MVPLHSQTGIKHETLINSINNFLTACTTLQRPTAEMGYGEPPNKTHAVKQIREYFNSRLKDPYSAKYAIGPFQRAYANNGILRGGEVVWMGYAVHVQVNAKNSYGAYVGAADYIAYFEQNGKLRNILSGTSDPLFHFVH